MSPKPHRALATLALCVAPVVARAASAQVPGIADTSSRARATHRITVVDSARLRATNARSPQDAIAATVPGATVLTIEGAPGRSPEIVLRGAAPHDVPVPVIVIDGVVSRLSLDDLNVDDIERIEVLEGPAATAGYGLGAANGVIRVITRRGYHLATGSSRFAIRSELATHLRPRILPINRHRAGADGIADDEYPVTYDAPGALLERRLLMSNHLTAQQRLGATGVGDLFASVRHERDPGMLALLSGYDERAVRVNFDRAFSRALSVDGGVFLLSASNDTPPASGVLFGMLRLIEPDGKIDSLLSPCPNFDACYVTSVPGGRLGPLPNPLRTIQNSIFDDSRNRVRGGINADYRFRQWLSARAGFTSDQNHVRSFSRQNLSSGPETTVDGEDRSSFGSVVVTLTPRLPLAAGNTTRAGWSRERTVRTSETVTIGTGGSFSNAFEITNVMPSWFASTAFEIGTRLVLDGAVRRDQPSLYGKRNHSTYHRLGANVRLLDGVRVHASHGTSGVMVPDSVLFTFSGTLVEPLTLPFVYETAVGTSISAGRLALGYDFALQRTANYRAWVPTPSSLGFSFVYRDIGDVVTRANELSLGARVFEGRNHQWRVDLVASRARSVMDRLYAPSFYVVRGPMFLVQEGLELNQIAGGRWIRTEAQLLETISTGQLAGTLADYVRNEEGYYVRGTQHRTANEVPLAYAQCTQVSGAACSAFETLFSLGRTTPDVALGLANTVRWKGLSLHANLTGAVGGVIFDNGRRADIARERDAVFDQSAKPLAERKPGAYYRAFGSNFPNEYFVEDASYVKLRDIAIDWQVLNRLSVGVVGRNLWTSSAYAGHDADVAVTSANLFDRNVDNFQYPAPRTIGMVVRLSSSYDPRPAVPAPQPRAN